MISWIALIVCISRVEVAGGLSEHADNLVITWPPLNALLTCRSDSPLEFEFELTEFGKTAAEAGRRVDLYLDGAHIIGFASAEWRKPMKHEMEITEDLALFMSAFESHRFEVVIEDIGEPAQLSFFYELQEDYTLYKCTTKAAVHCDNAEGTDCLAPWPHAAYGREEGAATLRGWDGVLAALLDELAAANITKRLLEVGT
eukprot:CAMPEP_0177741808 /NCGR_PEP_ID=MMETSP0484_2-20121128/28308_1 /TAXON_ID=354590 /ORGANISM="Rhodomonas lens, Strain RHODO" /LENGTH=199 /DNA_ID=CAMNT_0019256065 /DNA_START=31 /DNA_END=625 /DNA_ORIENTATION=-